MVALVRFLLMLCYNLAVAMLQLPLFKTCLLPALTPLSRVWLL